MASPFRTACPAAAVAPWLMAYGGPGGRGMSGDIEARAEWARLMAAAQDGDSASYRRLLEELAPVLRRVVGVRWRGTAEDVEDVVQDVLLSVHSVRHTYDPARPFLPWLMAIARHRIADASRRSGRRSEELAVDNLEETLGAIPTNSEMDGLPDREALRKAIADLPPGQRQAVEMLKLKEMSLKEAAATTGLSIPALKVAVHRAIRSLRTAMRKDEE